MGFAEKIYEHFYLRRKRDAESRRVQFDGVKIISIGNLTTGGTGKTPAVQWLVRSLQCNDGNPKIAVVGRGYGGEYSGRGSIVSDGEKILLDAQQGGDEALLHARSLNDVPVVIGRDREAAVKTAIDRFAPKIIVLDDGFQYWSLRRDFDLVLLDARKPFGNGKLLPEGRLREPTRALERAHGVLLTRADAATESELQRTKESVRAVTAAPVFCASHKAVGRRNERTGEVQSLEVLSPQSVAALSALADNDSFLAYINSLGSEVKSTLARRDHHHWQESEIRRYAAAARKNGVTAVVTTEKDAVKLKAKWFGDLTLYSLVIEMQIEQDDQLLQLIEKTLWG